MPEPTNQDVIDLGEVREHLRRFAADRDWEQFHTPKNLAMALAGEAGELIELFQWLTPEQSYDMSDPEQRTAVEDELADVLQYLVRIADQLDVNLGDALWRKLRKNERRYPAEQVKGTATKRPHPREDQL